MKTIRSMAGKVAVVTGASRGVGAGIATLLGEQGATAYVTGRATTSKPGTTPGTINEVADSITRAGGVGIITHARGVSVVLMALQHAWVSIEPLFSIE
jgi:NAD(P)-dependent dehydrogenase (short-subunit alcohol dehydrogenase family)